MHVLQAYSVDRYLCALFIFLSVRIPKRVVDRVDDKKQKKVFMLVRR